MGNNINLIQMFGPFDIECPYCGHVAPAEKFGLEEKDVDCTDYNPRPGTWAITAYDYWGCKKEFDIVLHVKIDTISIFKHRKWSQGGTEKAE